MLSSKFVPADLDPSELAQVEPLYRQLIEREINSPEELEQWLQDASDLDAVLDEFASRRYIDHTCHTDDEEIERAYLQLVEEIDPKLKPLDFELKKKLVACPHTSALDRSRFETLERSWNNAVGLYREENIPLETREAKLFADYSKVTGSMMIEFLGKQRTIQQMAKLLDEPDRELRAQAWQLVVERREKDREQLDEIFGRLLTTRQEISKNAGFDCYRDYAFRKRERFDYTPEDCLSFGDAIAEVCCPLVEALDRKKRETMGLKSLRPWDLSVDAKGRPPLRPFEEDQIPLFVEKIGTVFDKISPALGEMFSLLQPGRNLDLESRPGKRPGGYQASLEASRQPFIFMNAVGTRRDVETLLHEGGHAFHFLDAADESLVFLRHAPMEFCEVASMSMELLGSTFLEVFYSADDAARARRSLLEGIVRFLPWMATIDGFQHWLYTHPDHDAAERREAWLTIHDRFASREVDWSGWEETRAWRWQPQLHLFGMPFYYIEYGIAQLGALQVWQNYRNDPDEALARLRSAFRFGGTETLPELFGIAGLRFEFDRALLEPLISSIEDELRGLPM